MLSPVFGGGCCDTGGKSSQAEEEAMEDEALNGYPELVESFQE